MSRIPLVVRRLTAGSLAAAALIPAPAFAAPPGDSASLTMVPLGTVNTGGAEISAYDPLSRQLFVTNAGTLTVAVVSIQNPAAPAVMRTLDVSALGSPNSVDVSRGIVAVAIEDKTDKTRPGVVGFWRTNGEFLRSVRVGALPDMLRFSPDGAWLLVANEGEPNGYGTPTSVDPEGSVSIIRMPQHPDQLRKLTDGDVRTANFASFNGQEAALRAKGIRIYGPNATAAQDFEPEYITISPDSRTAYVTLQENNAIAKIDIASAKVTQLLPLGYKNWNAEPFAASIYEWQNDRLPPIGRTTAGQELRLGGFSGLVYEGTTGDGKLKFIVNTDRGPNAEPNALEQRPFLLPGFTPRLVRFTLDPVNGKLELTEQILLRKSDGTPLTGLPNLAIAAGSTNTPNNDEVPIDLFGKVLPLDRLGGDFEGLVVADDGTFWLPDEYRPALYHFDAKGRLLERYIPQGAHAAASLPVPAPGSAGVLGIEALPAVLGQRRQNRGMEALALKDGKLYAFVQSPLRNPASTANSTLNALRNTRVIEFDLATRAVTRQFLYVMDNAAGSGIDSRADKIGDAVSVPGGFLVLERDDDSITDDAATSDPLGTIAKRIYRFDLAGATNLTPAVDIAYDLGGGVVKTLDLMTTAELASVGVKPLAKALEVDLAKAGYTSAQKVEGLTVLDDGRLAVINDNDFTVAQIVVDTATGTFTRAPGYDGEPVTLGIIDRPGLDASDKDGNRINIRPWPVFGIYSPDSIAQYRVNGRQYLVTANEGDARDWPGFSEELRVKALGLDPAAFPTTFDWKNDANLGRLTVTSTLGNADADPDYEALYTLGGRSFSIWSSDGAQVFDSGSAFERIVASEHEKNFNVNNEDNDFDTRSDNKGPEPEGLAVGEIGGRHYAFVGLERDSGIVAYDITRPEAPLFVDYVSNRDFDTSAGTGDLGPEGVLFIPAIASPTFKPLLVVSNEISHTVTTYGLEVCARKPRLERRRAAFLFGWLATRFGMDSRCARSR